MMLYSIALFLHIVGALGLFVVLGLEWHSLLKLRRAANAEEARGWVNLIASFPRLYGPIWIAILLPAIYLVVTVWGWGTAWVAVSLATMLLLPILGAAVSGPRLQAIGRAVTAETGQLSSTFNDLLMDPFLLASIQVRIAVAISIVFLMTVKPSWGGAAASIAVGALLGLISTWLVLWRSRR